MAGLVGWGLRKGWVVAFLCPGHGISFALLEDEERAKLSCSECGGKRKLKKLAFRPSVQRRAQPTASM